MTDLAVFITSRAQPGRRDEIFELYRKLLAPRAEANANQRVVVWAADEQDPDAFHLFELYTDAAAMEANAAAPWFAEYLEQAMPLLAGQPTVAMAGPRWSTGL